MELTLRNLQSSIPITQSKVKSVVNEAFRVLRLSNDFQAISIVFVGTRRMRSINKKYLGHDFVTDVITFDLNGTGEIIICPLVAQANAKLNDQSLDHEIILYVIHGLLHLAGYDDHKINDIKKMRSREKELMGRLL